MLQTTPTFQEFQFSDLHPMRYWVFISQWVFSQMDVHDWPWPVPIAISALVEPPTFSQNANLRERRSSTGNITIKLDNRVTYNGQRPSQMLASVLGQGVQVLVSTGPPTDWNNFLRVWDGVAISAASHDENFCTIEAESSCTNKWPMIPRLESGAHSDTPHVQGDFPMYFSTWLWNRGRVKGAGNIDLSENPLGVGIWHLNDNHDCTPTDVWLWCPQFKAMCLLDSDQWSLLYDPILQRYYIEIVDISDLRGTFILSPDRTRPDDWTQPIGEYNPGSVHAYFNNGKNAIRDFDNLKDGDTSTEATLTAGDMAYDAYTWVQKGMLVLGWDDVLEAGYDDLIETSDAIGVTNLNWRISENLSIQPPYSHYYYASVGAPGSMMSAVWDNQGATYPVWGPTWIFNGSNNYVALDSPQNFADAVGPWLSTNHFRLYVMAHIYRAETFQIPPPTIVDLIYVKEINLTMPVKLDLRSVHDQVELWWNGAGPKIGATIGARPGLPGATFTNEWAGIWVEKLLREYCSITNIDTDSFDQIFAPGGPDHVRGVIYPEDKIRADDLIQEIAENSNFSFHYDFVGKARALMISPDQPATADRTFGIEDLIELPTLGSEKTTDLTNRIDVKDNWEQKDREAWVSMNTTRIEDAAAQGSMGILDSDAEMRFVNGYIDTGYVKWHLLDLMAWPHVWCEVSVKGARAADVEIGDWFDFKTELANRMPAFGTSTWDYYMFMVLGKKFIAEGVVLFGMSIGTPAGQTPPWKAFYYNLDFSESYNSQYLAMT